MNKAKLVVLIITILLLLTGVAYARWTDQINILISTKTAETELSYVDYTSRSGSGNASVSRGGSVQANVSFRELEPGTSSSVTLHFKNTGTIPIDIDDIKVLYVDGYSDEYKNDINLTISGYCDEKRFVEGGDKIFHWRINHSISKRGELYELPVNGVISIICEVEFEDVKAKDNYGQSKKEESKTETEEPIIKQDVSFVIVVDYSRFNKN
jgi:hypothetical protein